MATKKDLLKKLLKGIEIGDPEAATVVNEAKYIQHNPQTHEGSEGPDGLGVDAELPAQLRERSLRSLYCCSDGVRALSADLPCKSPAG